MAILTEKLGAKTKSTSVLAMLLKWDCF